MCSLVLMIQYMNDVTLNATTCPLRLRGPPPPLWLKCNRLLRLGRPVGVVTLSRWEWWWNERWIWGARGALNLISTNYPDHGHHGRLPLSRKNAHGRAGNRTRDLMVSSQELWPPSHEAGQFIINIRSWKVTNWLTECNSAFLVTFLNKIPSGGFFWRPKFRVTGYP